MSDRNVPLGPPIHPRQPNTVMSRQSFTDDPKIHIFWADTEESDYLTKPDAFQFPETPYTSPKTYCAVNKVIEIPRCVRFSTAEPLTRIVPGTSPIEFDYTKTDALFSPFAKAIQSFINTLSSEIYFQMDARDILGANPRINNLGQPVPETEDVFGGNTLTFCVVHDVVLHNWFNTGTYTPFEPIVPLSLNGNSDTILTEMQQACLNLYKSHSIWMRWSDRSWMDAENIELYGEYNGSDYNLLWDAVINGDFGIELPNEENCSIEIGPNFTFDLSYVTQKIKDHFRLPA